MSPKIDRLLSEREPMIPRRDRTCRSRRARFGVAAILGGSIAAAALIAPPAAQAQMPPDLAEKIAAMGRVVDPENTG